MSAPAYGFDHFIFKIIFFLRSLRLNSGFEHFKLEYFKFEGFKLGAGSVYTCGLVVQRARCIRAGSLYTCGLVADCGGASAPTVRRVNSRKHV